MKRFALIATTAAVAITGAAHAFPGQEPGDSRFAVDIEQYDARTAPADQVTPGSSRLSLEQDPDAGLANASREMIGDYTVIQDYARLQLTAPEPGTVYAIDGTTVYELSLESGEPVRVVGDAVTLTK